MAQGDRTFNVFLQTGASATIPVTVPADVQRRVAETLGLEREDLTPGHLRDVIMDLAYDNTPTLGNCCAGGNWSGQPSLELGDEWETAEEANVARPARPTRPDDVMIETTPGAATRLESDGRR